MIVLSASAKESITVQDIAGEESAKFQPKEESRINTTEPKGETKSDREQPRSTELGGTQVEPKEEADDAMDVAVCYLEGGDIFSEDVENNMAPAGSEGYHEGRTIDDIQVDDPHATPEERKRLRNAFPPPAFGAICDIDVGTAKPVAQRCRRVAPQFREKLSMLIHGLLSTKIITTSTSPWASPIVVIIKANGVDIRLCIDYQVVNSLTRLVVYRMPLMNDLLEDLDNALWYGSLDMASAFWVVSMTPRARLVSAFITPFGLFEWTRISFGLKNAPQTYQRIVDNGYMRIKPDQDRSSPVDIFEEGEPEPKPKASVLGRRSYVDEILVTGDTWDSMCNRVDKLLDKLSISVAKSYWGRRKVAYLGHEVSSAGLEAIPKELDTIDNLPFPTKPKAMQSFLGCLNYYSRFIEDFAVYSAILYELREAHFHAVAKLDAEKARKTRNDDSQITGGERDRWARAKNAFTMLEAKIIATPVLKHFNTEGTPVIVLYAYKSAVSAALMQEHDGVYHPVTFTSHTLKENELNYGVMYWLFCESWTSGFAAGYQIDQGLVTILDIGLAALVERVRRSTG
ncbi:reverse transcriptase [Phytophthora megakarya]|uniref:Reverse transcriptase n=1 Tax=Phytophthora megakarya TaxID=4795 RepID=A0A225W9D5_9STRA|nr:reverse transcriptase [Phytophthora megakarya]